jgi:hypothetical protein
MCRMWNACHCTNTIRFTSIKEKNGTKENI